MSSSPARPDPANNASPAQASQRDEDAQYYRQVLHELVETGSRLARKLTDPAQLSPAARAVADAQQRRTVARKQIIRDLEDTIHREAHGRKAETEALHA